MNTNIKDVKYIAKQLDAWRIGGDFYGEYQCHINCICDEYPVLSHSCLEMVWNQKRDDIIASIDKIVYDNGQVDYYYWINQFAEKGL